jgi:hypothetical protein
MRVLIATALAVATVGVFCFVGALPALLHGPTEGFQAGEAGALGMYFVFGLAFGVAAAVCVFIFAFAFLSPTSRKGTT